MEFSYNFIDDDNSEVFLKKTLYLLATLISFQSFALLPFEKEIMNVYQDVIPSVVSVTSHRIAGNWYHGMVEVPAGMGSGFVWDKDGHIVTNFHVVEKSKSFKINFHNDPKEYEAKLVGTDPNKDIAVLKLIGKLPSKIKPIEVGHSKTLEVGQLSIALGNPFGLKHSMSMGIISALQRQIEGIGGVKIYDMIQTDAAINRGNSGGPLVDSSGKLIGMNTMIYSTSGSSAGLGFAVPSDIISKIIPQLIKYGKNRRPGLGIGVLPDEMKQQLFGLDKGIIVSSIQEGGAADKAGLQGIKRDSRGRLIMGDVIHQIDNKKINSYDDIYNLFDNYQIGDTVKVYYSRENKKRSTKMTLGAI